MEGEKKQKSEFSKGLRKGSLEFDFEEFLEQGDWLIKKKPICKIIIKSGTKKAVRVSKA